MLPVHPGRVLKRELAARGLSANRLALALRVPSGRITDILNGKRGVRRRPHCGSGGFLETAPAFGSTSRLLMSSLLPNVRSASA